MNKPNRNIALTKTNYWGNLKKKASNPKDQKEQATVNKELMNCISILEGRIIVLERVVEELAKGADIDTDIQQHIIAHINAIEETIGREKVREVFDRLVKEQSKENDENE